MTDDAARSLERLRKFAFTFNDGDMVDEESGLSANDLKNVISALDAQLGEDIAASALPTVSQGKAQQDILVQLVVALAASVARMGLLYNHRLNGADPETLVPLHEAWNTALRHQHEVTAKFSEIYGVAP